MKLPLLPSRWHRTVAATLALAALLLTPATSHAQGRLLTEAGLFTGFQEPTVGANSYTPGATGTELGWTTGGGTVQEDSNTGAGNQAFILNAASTASTLFRTEAVDIRGITYIKLSVKLRAYTTSTSGFESADRIRIYPEVSTNGTSFVAIATTNDLVRNVAGSSGVDAILAAYGPGNFGINPDPATFVEASVIIANTNATPYRSLRIAMNAINDSGSEYFVIDDIRISIPVCNVNTAISGLTRTVTSIATPDTDTYTFKLALTNDLPGLTGWTSTSDPAHVSGNYSATSLVTFGPYTVGGGSKTLTFTDSATPGCSTTITVEPPSRYILGEIDVPGTQRPLYPALSPVPPTSWVNNPDEASATKTGGGASQVLTSETVNLAGISGPVFFVMTLEAHSNSTSNFESADTFKAELILNNGSTNTTVNLTNAPAFDKNGNGLLNGSGTSAATYAPAADEFNVTNAAYGNPVDSVFEFNHTIPDNIVSARLVITASSDSTSEIFVVRGIKFSSTFVAPPDDDGDGLSNADEQTAGTDPNDPSSVLRVRSIEAEVVSDFGQTAMIVTGRFLSVLGRYYRVYTSDDLNVWTLDDSVSTIEGADQQSEFNAYFLFDPADPQTVVPKRFYRVHVMLSDGPWPQISQ